MRLIDYEVLFPCIYKQAVSYDHQQENCDRLATNHELAIGQNEIYEEVSEYTNSTFNAKHNISYCS